MPTLDWIGKKAVITHHKEVPYRLLEPVAELSHGDPNSGNLIVQGDNLHALKALLPRYAGQVKCIYIDPPYNTGNENWVYNDNVNSPEIRRWLGEVVGKEAEDLSRHDKWLCMMYPRLVMLKQFLREDGAIFVSIDDNEVATLRLLMDEIFGARNFIGIFIQKRRDTPDSRNIDGLSPDHEYVVCFKKGGDFRFRGQEKDVNKYSNPDNDTRGPWMSDNLTGLANAKERPNLHYPVVNPQTGLAYPPHERRGWAVSNETMNRLIAEERILWPKSKTGRPRIKRFLSDLSSLWTGLSTVLKTPGNIAGTRELNNIFSDKVFSFPKPVQLVQTLILQSTDENSIILDSFSGSGTTAHAVLNQNFEDGGNRRFIMVEMDPQIAITVTAKRVRRVAAGYSNEKGKRIDGLGGSFQFCRLSDEPLFNADGQIRSNVTFVQLAEFVWFTETGSGYTGTADSPMLGEHEGRAIYLLYNGILKDRSANGGNSLTSPVLSVLPLFKGPKVIYATRNLIGRARTEKLGIQFKQTPYALEI